MNFSFEKLSDILEQNVPEIDFAFLFGSAQKGDAEKTSDIDIGVYLNAPVTIALLLKIAEKVETHTHKRCDLSILNTASEILRFEALKGRLLFVRKDKMDEYAGFYSRTCREYEDAMFWMQKQRAYRGYA